MKKFSKIMAVILTLTMMFSFAGIAAADPVKGSIQMEDSQDGSVAASSKTFNAYKVLDVTYSGENFSYSIPAEPAGLKAALASAFEVTEKGNSETDEAYAQRIVKAIETAANNNVEATAKTLLQVAKDAKVAAQAINGATKKTGLDLGYYVIEDSTTGTNARPVAAIGLTTTHPDATIKVKATKPTLEKKIDEGSTTGAIDPADVVYDNHRVGDKVPYILKTTIPEMTGYTKYFFNINDTLSKGLTFDDNVVIKVTKAAYTEPAYTDEEGIEHDAVEHPAVTRTLTDADYSVSYSTDAVTGETAVEIIFKDFYNKEKDHAGEEVIITYSATINADAVIGVEGNPNTAKLIYSNNPNEEQKPDDDNQDKPHKDTVTGVTPEQQTRTYVTGVKLIKFSNEGSTENPLAGATFELSGNLTKVEITKAEKYVEDANGTWFALKDGSYTEQDPTRLDAQAENYRELLAKYQDPTGATKFKKATVTEKTASGTPKAVSDTTDENGFIVFDGMGDGKFTITETEAPEGYNKLTSPIEFEAEWVAPTSQSTDCQWKVKDNSVTEGYDVTYNSTTGEFEIKIENKTGTELPATGGVGTTIFYIAGSMMVIGAAVLMVTRRRMSQN